MTSYIDERRTRHWILQCKHCNRIVGIDTSRPKDICMNVLPKNNLWSDPVMYRLQDATSEHITREGLRFEKNSPDWYRTWGRAWKLKPHYTKIIIKNEKRRQL